MSATSFSRRDAAILLGGIAAGIMLLCSIHRIDQRMSPEARQLGGETTLCEELLMGIVAGAACAGPIVLLAQRVRGRTSKIRFGEWFWLVPLLLYLMAISGSWFINERLLPDFFHLLWFGAWILVQGVSSLIALFAAFRSNLPWTDRFGCLSCFSVGATIVINLLLHPLDI